MKNQKILQGNAAQNSAIPSTNEARSGAGELDAAPPEKNEPTPVDVLRRMKRLLRKGWTQRVSARDKQGDPVGLNTESATHFCLLGAEHRAVAELHAPCGTIKCVEGFIRECLPTSDILAFNDAIGRTKKEVLAVVDCAIEKAAG